MAGRPHGWPAFLISAPRVSSPQNEAQLGSRPRTRAMPRASPAGDLLAPAPVAGPPRTLLRTAPVPALTTTRGARTIGMRGSWPAPCALRVGTLPGARRGGIARWRERSRSCDGGRWPQRSSRVGDSARVRWTGGRPRSISSRPRSISSRLGDGADGPQKRDAPGPRSLVGSIRRL